MASKVKYLDEQRKDVLMVDVRLIEPDFDWNPQEKILSSIFSCSI